MCLQEQACASNDKYFALDAALLTGISGETGEQILTNKLYSFFPSSDDDDATSVAAAATNVQTLSQTPLCSFASAGLQGHVNIACDIALAIKMRIAPKFQKGKLAPTVQRCLDLCAHFPRFQKNEKAKVWKGQEALQQRYAEIERLTNDKCKPDVKKAELTHELLSDLKVFWWIVPKEWAEKISQAEVYLQGENGVIIDVASTSTSSSSGGPASKKAKTAASSSSSSTAPTKEQLLRSSVLSKY